jgi:hypothetical protein
MSGATSQNVLIVSPPDAMVEGVFGQVLLHVFETLPYLRERGIWPDWEIYAAHYASRPGGTVIPGIVDIAYPVASGPKHKIALADIRNIHCQVLGNDWNALGKLWSAYFRVPGRILELADRTGVSSNALGVHYRGTDKVDAQWDTNYVSHDDFLVIIREALSRRPELTHIFLATDEPEFCNYLREQLPVEVINLGAIGFHRDPVTADEVGARTDRAMLDCVLLSRCGLVLLNSSALSAFAKVLNPNLEIFRVAASKLFADVPYFPVAYVPPYISSDPEVSVLLKRLMLDDWTTSARADQFKRGFVSRPRYGARTRLTRGVRSWLSGYRKLAQNSAPWARGP